MVTVAFVVHPENPDAQSIARRTEQWLRARNHDTLLVGDAGAPVEATGGTGERPTPAFDATVGLAVSLGGDGTMLRTVALAGSAGVPVLGVNLGRLGYLTEIEPAGLITALERFLADDYSLETRMTLEVSLERGNEPPASGARTTVVLNEAAVEKTVPGHTIRVATTIAGKPFVTYVADGLLVATPTGSTAYNLSARGPIMSPGLRAVVLTPISPHMLFDRPVVLEPEQWVRLELVGPRSAALVLDGQSVDVLEPGDAVVCRAGPTPVHFVTFGPRDFFSILRARFHLADR